MIIDAGGEVSEVEGGEHQQGTAERTPTGTLRAVTTTTRYQKTTASPWESPGTALYDWCISMRAEGLASRTTNERPRIIARISEDLETDPCTLASAAIELWLAGLLNTKGEPASVGTKATYHGALRAWHLWLERAGRRTDNPMTQLRTPRVPRRLPRPVATPNLQLLLDSRMHRRTRVMVHLATYHGLRAHEVAKLRGRDIDLVAGTLTVAGKGGSLDTVPLHPVVSHDARVMPRDGYWFPGPNGQGHVRRESVSAIISRALKRAGVPATGHQLRHWYGTELVRSGTDIRVAQTLMRHKSLASTALYTAVDDGQQRAAVQRLPVLQERGRAA